jgi:hypothetical protein
MITTILIALLLIVLACALIQYLPFIPANMKQLLIIVVVIIGIIYMISGSGAIRL